MNETARTLTPMETEKAELALLGSTIVNPEGVFTIPHVTAEHFVDRWRGVYFWRLREAIFAGEKPDANVLDSYTEGEGDTQKLIEISQRVKHPDNIMTYASLVLRASTSRSRVAAIEKAKLLLKKDEDAAVQELIKTLTENNSAISRPLTFDEALAQHAIEVEERRQLGELMKFPLPFWNKNTQGGMLPGNVVILAGLPGSYKTTAAMQSVLMAARTQHHCGVFSLETTAEELASSQVEDGASFSGLPIEFSHESHVDAITAQIAQWVHRKNTELVVVDFLQRVSASGNGLREQVTNAIHQLKDVALRHKIHIIVLSHLARNLVNENRLPRDQDLRESGAIEGAADTIFFLHKHKTNAQAEEQLVSLIGKNRRGRANIGPIDIQPNGSHTRIFEKARYGDGKFGGYA